MLFITLLHLYPLLTNEELWLVHANYYMAWFNWTTMDNQRECTMIPWLRGEGKCVPQWAPRLSSSRWRRVRKRMPPLGFSEQLRRFAGHDSKKKGMMTPNDLTPSITPTGIRLSHSHTDFSLVISAGPLTGCKSTKLGQDEKDADGRRVIYLGWRFHHVSSLQRDHALGPIRWSSRVFLEDWMI